VISHWQRLCCWPFGGQVILITHPVVWFLIPHRLPNRTAYLLGAEAFALVTKSVGQSEKYFLRHRRLALP